MVGPRSDDQWKNKGEAWLVSGEHRIERTGRVPACTNSTSSTIATNRRLVLRHRVSQIILLPSSPARDPINLDDNFFFFETINQLAGNHMDWAGRSHQVHE